MRRRRTQERKTSRRRMRRRRTQERKTMRAQVRFFSAPSRWWLPASSPPELFSPLWSCSCSSSPTWSCAQLTDAGPLTVFDRRQCTATFTTVHSQTRYFPLFLFLICLALAEASLSSSGAHFPSFWNHKLIFAVLANFF